MGWIARLPVQYVTWLTGEDWVPTTETDGRAANVSAIQTDCSAKASFGWILGAHSRSKANPVIDLIVERIPATFLLGFSSLVISVVVGVPLGIIWR